MTWQVPWVISGVAQMPIDVARVVAYVSTSGREGIIGPGDLKIEQTATASGNITTAPGAFVTVSRFVGAQYESYIGRNQSSYVTTAVPATTTAARSDLVYAHIIDPGQSGQPATAGPIETRVITGVSSSVTRLQDVPGYANQSGYALARIDRLAGVNTVSTSQIVDLRSLAAPRSDQQMFISPNAVFNADYLVNGSTQADWGSTKYAPTVSIPSWAKRCLIVAHVDGAYVADTSANVYGVILVRLGTQQSNYTSIDLPTSTGAQRVNATAYASLDVSSLAGTSQTLKIQGYQSLPASAPTTKRLQLVGGSTMAFDVRFFEQ